MPQLFRIDFDSLSDAYEYFDDLKHPLGHASTEAMRDVSTMARDRVRRQVKRNFRDSPHRYRGQNFEKAVRTYDWPKRGGVKDFSYQPAATIQVESSWAHAFEEGARIFPKAAGALAIPLEDAEEQGLARSTRMKDPTDVLGKWRHHQKHSLTDVARERFGSTFLIDAQGGGKIVAAEDGKGALLKLFLLLPSVKEPRLLSFYDSAKAAHRLLPRRFQAELPRSKAKFGKT